MKANSGSGQKTQMVALAMRYRLLLLMSATAILVVTAWAARNIFDDQSELTAAAAKEALIELSERSGDSELRQFLEPVKHAELEMEEDGQIAKSGPLTCDLAGRTFVLLVVSTDADAFIAWTGTFMRRNGKWVATAAETARACPPPAGWAVESQALPEARK